MTKGTIKWFNETKGFGFITDETGQDIFVHYSNLQIKGYRTIEKDTPVEFELADKDGKKQALNVRPI